MYVVKDKRIKRMAYKILKRECLPLGEGRNDSEDGYTKGFDNICSSLLIILNG